MMRFRLDWCAAVSALGFSPFVGLSRPLLFTFAGLATLATLALLFNMVRTVGHAGPERVRIGRQDRRRRRPIERRDPREALALVGSALAATHDPRALLPVMLQVVTEATGARGGRVLDGGEEVAWTGEVEHSADGLDLELPSRTGTPTKMILYPPPEGFAPETRELAEWLASQAAIGLENARLHHTVQRQAITDELTGLVNRRRFLESLETELERATAFSSPLSVVLADLDDFKLVNDRFGHHAGDEVLRTLAALMRVHLRDIDVPGRLGGEEFAILLPETDAAGAAAVAERIRQSLSEAALAFRDGEPVTVTSSFGVAQLEEGQSGDDLLRRADAALYQAKADGKNRVSLATERVSP